MNGVFLNKGQSRGYPRCPTALPPLPSPYNAQVKVNLTIIGSDFNGLLAVAKEETEARNTLVQWTDIAREAIKDYLVKYSQKAPKL